MLKIQSVRLSRNLNYYTQYNLTVEPADQLRGAGKNPAVQLSGAGENYQFMRLHLNDSSLKKLNPV